MDEKIFGTITQEELKEYASLVKYYFEKNKFKEGNVTEWYKLDGVQQNADFEKVFI